MPLLSISHAHRVGLDVLLSWNDTWNGLHPAIVPAVKSALGGNPNSQLLAFSFVINCGPQGLFAILKSTISAPPAISDTVLNVLLSVFVPTA